MTRAPTLPDAPLPDAAAGNWVDRHAPAGLRPWLKLGRFDRPAGIWLLMLPGWMGIALAGAMQQRWPDPVLMVLFLAGLTAIPRELYAAAEVDGARSAWDRFRLVTWPLLGPTTLFVVTISLVRSLRVFDTVAVLTQGGPNKASEVLLYTMYQEGFTYLRLGYSAAITLVFLVVVLALMALQTRVLDRRVHYG
jgi:ABC-type sugar transport system permease subunit